MAKTVPCKCKEVECEECPEWIFTLADLIMCMMGLFVILWVLKPAGSGSGASAGAAGAPKLDDDLTKVMAAIREKFGYIPNADNPDVVDLQMIMEKLRRIKLDGPGEGGKTQIRPKGSDGPDQEVTSIRPGLQSVVGGRLLFEPGDATPSREVRTALGQIAAQIRGHRNVVVVKGHTALDDLLDSATPQQRMDLSLRRAQAIADHLVTNGVEPEILRVEGCSTFEPVVQRAYSEDVRSLNRRVEVEATATLVEDLQDRPTTATAATDPVAPATSAPAKHPAPASRGH
jgi:flagellar motor protein MotB